VVFVLKSSYCCFLKCLAVRCQLINPLTCNSVTYSNKGNFGFRQPLLFDFVVTTCFEICEMKIEAA